MPDRIDELERRVVLLERQLSGILHRLDGAPAPKLPWLRLPTPDEQAAIERSVKAFLVQIGADHLTPTPSDVRTAMMLAAGDGKSTDGPTMGQEIVQMREE